MLDFDIFRMRFVEKLMIQYLNTGAMMKNNSDLINLSDTCGYAP